VLPGGAQALPVARHPDHLTAYVVEGRLRQDELVRIERARAWRRSADWVSTPG